MKFEDIEIIQNLDKKIQNFEIKVNELGGSIKLLEKQYKESTEKLTNLETLQSTNIKAIELLKLVQKVTKDLIKETFESICTKALQYIHQSNDYNFDLEFGSRGHIPELQFNIKTPDMTESHSIIDTRGGGSADIISMALRLVLLEVAKMSGFLFLDEPFKHLDSPETIKKAIAFIQEIQRDSQRQMFIITHKDEVINSVENPIIIKENRINKS